MWDHWFMGNRWKMRSMGARRGCDGWRAKGSRAVCLQLAGGGVPVGGSEPGAEGRMRVYQMTKVRRASREGCIGRMGLSQALG